MTTIVIERRNITAAALRTLLDDWLRDGDYNITIKATLLKQQPK